MAVGRSLLNEQSPRILPGLPRKSLTPEQQLEALRKVQAQAEQRVKLGMQLFKSAEARLAAHADLVSQVRNEQKNLREKVTQDVADRLTSYDRKLDQLDDRLDEVVRALEGKIDAIAAEWRDTQGQLQQTRDRCEALLAQSQRLLDEGAAIRYTARPAEDVTPLEQLEDLEEPAPRPSPLQRAGTDEPQVGSELEADHEVFPDPIPLPQQAAVEPEPAEEQGAEADAAADLDPEERVYSQILRRLREQDAA